MKLLALDTSSMTATVALFDDNKLIGEYTLNHKRSHSQKLMPMIEEIIKSCDLTPKEIDAFAVSLGPGSFTGLRIGIATVTAMAQALDKMVVGVPTLEALAFNLFNSEGLVCPIIDAQRDLVYTGVYQWMDGNMMEVVKQQVLHIDELISILKEEDKYVEERHHKHITLLMEIFWEDNEEMTKSSKQHITHFPPEVIILYELLSIFELITDFYEDV